MVLPDGADTPRASLQALHGSLVRIPPPSKERLAHHDVESVRSAPTNRRSAPDAHTAAFAREASVSQVEPQTTGTDELREERRHQDLLPLPQANAEVDDRGPCAPCRSTTLSRSSTAGSRSSACARVPARPALGQTSGARVWGECGRDFSSPCEQLPDGGAASLVRDVPHQLALGTRAWAIRGVRCRRPRGVARVYGHERRWTGSTTPRSCSQAGSRGDPRPARPRLAPFADEPENEGSRICSAAVELPLIPRSRKPSNGMSPALIAAPGARCRARCMTALAGTPAARAAD